MDNEGGADERPEVGPRLDTMGPVYEAGAAARDNGNVRPNDANVSMEVYNGRFCNMASLSTSVWMVI